MLALKDIEKVLGTCSCIISSCDNKVFETYVTLEGRHLPLCKTHYELINSGVLW